MLEYHLKILLPLFDMQFAFYSSSCPTTLSRKTLASRYRDYGICKSSYWRDYSDIVTDGGSNCEMG